MIPQCTHKYLPYSNYIRLFFNRFRACPYFPYLFGMNLTPIKEKSRANKAAPECTPQTKLRGVTFSQLVKAFGRPVLDTSANPGSGGRRTLLNTCYRFVFDFEGEAVTVCDWRNPSLDYVENDLTTWIVGASCPEVGADAVKALLSGIKNPPSKKKKASEVE